MTEKIMHTKPTNDSQISLFFKSYTIKASSIFILISLITSVPATANAGFFDFITGAKAQATEVNNKSLALDESSNSQNVPLLETSIDPDMKNSNSDTSVSIMEDGTLLSDDSQGTDSSTNPYISSSEKITTYKVEKGDTLAKVASKFGISKNTIMYANTNVKDNALKVGQVLTILPVDVSYTVKKGDNLSSIAKAHKALASDIAEYNDITDKSLKIGDKIIVPGGVAIKKVEAPRPIVKVEQDQTETNTQVSQIDNKVTKTEANPEDISSGNGITGDYIWPFPKGTGRVSQRLHDDNAYDFAAPKGTPIYAIQDGTVLIADGSGYNGGYGLYVVINFDDGGQAIFGHMSKVVAEAGEIVKQGDIIGYVGSTGRSTGPHVHIGYRGGKLNPYRNLPKGSSL